MLEILIMNLILQEARDAFIEALDDYIKKCQELSTEINQSKDHDNAGSTKMESKDFEKDGHFGHGSGGCLNKGGCLDKGGNLSKDSRFDKYD